jgi:hypothetical protein
MIIQQALRWWRMRRAPGMKLEHHVKEPTINCTSSEEFGLALAIAQFVEYTRKKNNDEAQEW